MKILLVNGSPRGTGSSTLKLANAFLSGMAEVGGHHADSIDLSMEDIGHCMGCFACWHTADGTCTLNDAMSALIKKYLNADLIVWSFPLYYFGMPSKAKAFLDRLLPLNHPQIIIRSDGTASHLARHDLSAQRHVLISTCGFYSVKGNYEALLAQFNLLFGDRVTKIICPEGELFRVPQLAARTKEYLFYIKEAGRDYSRQGVIADETYAHINTLLFPAATFVEMANAYWTARLPAQHDDTGEKPGEAFSFLRQMASLYNPRGHKNDIIIEMKFTDIGETYQLSLGKESCEVTNGASSPYTTRIETPFSLWKDISEGKVNGAEALMSKRYRVLGDFSTMRKIGDYFSAKESHKSAASVPRTTMVTLLLPWLVFWILLPRDARMSGLAGVAASSLLPLLGLKYKLTIYEALTAIFVSLLSLAALYSFPTAPLLSLSYLLFGGMWALSCLASTPLSAHYSCNAHGGEKAFSNPLFIRTNRILTLAWGGLYIIIAAYSYISLIQGENPYIWAINTAIPILMGLFTAWFVGWYPAKMARG